MLALCPACGARFNFPFVTDEIRDRVAAEQAAGQVRSNWKTAQPWLWGVVATVVMGLIITLVWALTVFPAMLAQRAEANTYLHQASDQAVQGKYAEARDTYLALVNLHPDPPSDQKLRDEVEFARQQASVMDARANGTFAPLAPSPASVAVVRPIVPSVHTPIQPGPPTVPGNPTIASATVTPPPAPAVAPPATKPAEVAPHLPLVQPLNLPGGLTDAQIDDSIQKAVDYLMSEMDLERFELRPNVGDIDGGSAYHTGLDALYVYSLIMAGQTIDDARLSERGPFIKGCLDRLKMLPADGYRSVYARGLRLAALSALNRPEDKEAIRADAVWLVTANRNGAYTYDTAAGAIGSDEIDWDNSNSQYGLLGVWSAAESGVSISMRYWEEVQKHWSTCQVPDGRWPYKQGGDGTLSMTCAGVASLFVTHDYLDSANYADKPGRDRLPTALEKALGWLETGDRCVDIIGSTNWPGYTYYGVERAGLASGYKYFGVHDWYRDIAVQLIQGQNAVGSWGNDNIGDTAYCLLFLARGSHPIIMNKLRFPGFWNNRPSDLQHLARYAGEQLERPLNWQIVPVDHGWPDWTDSPVLYIASTVPPDITPQQEQGLRAYVEAGGLLFTQSDGESPAFSKWATELSQRLFPNYPLKPVTPDSDLFSVVIKLNRNPLAARFLKLRAVSNGARYLMVQSDGDLSKAWQLKDTHDTLAFDMGMNLFVYASGKKELRNRLTSLYIPPVEAAPVHMLKVARLRYAGNWNPEPRAWQRMGRVFTLATGWGIDLSDLDLATLKPGSADVAVITGNDAAQFAPADAAAIRDFVKAGGVVLIDVCGGRGAFDQSVADQLIPVAFPGGRLHPLTNNDPLISPGLPGMMNLSKPRLRLYAEQSATYLPALPLELSYGAGHLIYSPIDLTSGLLGTGTWGINGYTSDYSSSFVQNLLLWTARGQKEAP